MKQTKEFTGLLCNLYLVALAAVLPLYTDGSYWMIGDTKYLFFRNVTLACLGIGAAVMLIAEVGERLSSHLRDNAPESRLLGKRWSALDIAVLLYGVTVCLSALLSSYRETAWFGFREWYMGAVSQLLFVGIYFFISRSYDGSGYPLWLWSIAFFAVVVLGFCNRFGADPAGLLAGYNSGDWEYSHMISTIGNINWFCGYAGVAIAIPLSGCLYGRRDWRQLALYPVSAAGLTLLVIQGCDTGIVVTAVCFGICVLLGVRNRSVMRRTLFLAAGVSVLLPGYGRIVTLMGTEALKALPADGIGIDRLLWNGWWLVGAVCLLLGIFTERAAHFLCADEKRRHHIRIGMAVLAGILILSALAAGVLFFVHRSREGVWGSGRGVLWRLAVEGFLQNDFLGKLFGVGPDCFAEYIYSTFPPEELLTLSGRWAGAVYANAHNEWLNHLVNLGIMGTGCYLAVFAAGIVRCRKAALRQGGGKRIAAAGMLAVLLYGVVSCTCFQQCLSTPLFFAVLGLCESSLRRGGELTENSRAQERHGNRL